MAVYYRAIELFYSIFIRLNESCHSIATVPCVTHLL